MDAASEAAYGQMEVLARALFYMDSRAGTAPSLERLVRAAIRGMLREVDSNSRYLSAAELQRWEQSSEVGELGFGIEGVAGGFVVTKIEEGMPAQKAGIREGDILLSVDEQPLQGLSAAEVRNQLMGPVGSQAILKLKREGFWQVLRIRLERIPQGLSPLETYWVDAIWVIRLSRFSPGIAAELHKRLFEARQRKPESIILDVRGNLGGLLQEAFGVASFFLPPQAAIVHIENPRKKDSRLEQTTSTQNIAVEIPMVVLMDGNSASVTEVLVAALKDNGRAYLLGEKSYGKGSIQERLLLPDGSALYLTVAYFIRLTGAKIDGEGVVPDCNLHHPKECVGFDKLMLKAQTPPPEGSKDIWLEWAVAWLRAHGRK
ncbi:MAG: S41 family peptidase [Proteobacteria bacterium]|nr:S41 family peptidase [Pseudomonadota bacterium]